MPALNPYLDPAGAFDSDVFASEVFADSVFEQEDKTKAQNRTRVKLKIERFIIKGVIKIIIRE
jgi:hypothetical protein